MPKILYIEDTENNRILVERKLRRSGYEVVTAVDAESGLALAARELVFNVLSDLFLHSLHRRWRIVDSLAVHVASSGPCALPPLLLFPKCPCIIDEPSAQQL